MKVFSNWLEQLRERLVRNDKLEKADLIFVLAGHPNRKVHGARLFRDGWSPRVLMSTGDPAYIARVLESEAAPPGKPSTHVWEQVHEASMLPSPETGHFFASLDDAQWSVEAIPISWFGTLSEIKALARWLEQHSAIRSLLIVSLGMHLKRAQMCCQRLLPKDCRIRLIAVPTHVQGASGRRPTRERADPSRILIEWSKVLLYRVVLAACARPGRLGSREPR